MNDDDDDDGVDCDDDDDDEDEKCRNVDCGSLIFWLVVDNVEDNEVCCERWCWQRIAETVLVRCVHGDAWQTRSRETNEDTILIVGKFCRTTNI